MVLNKKINGLGPKTLKKVRQDKLLQAMIADKASRSNRTVERWVEQNADGLTLPSSMDMICAKLKITQEQALNQ